MNGDPAVIKALQAMLSAEAHLNMQYRLDTRILKFMGVKKTAHKIKGLGDKAHDFQKIVTDRILFLGGDVNFSVPPIQQVQPLTPILEHELQLETAIADMGRKTIETAVQAGDEDTAEKMRHVEERHEDAMDWLGQQLRLIAKIGEQNYITEAM